MTSAGHDANGVPVALRELLELFAQLARDLPQPADGNYAARHEAEIHRAAILGTRLDTLDMVLKTGDRHPSVAAESLAVYCRGATESLRALLSEPLGYEPQREEG